MTERRSFKWPALLTSTGRGIAFGGDYNPDQWPDEVIDDDIRLMREAHVNTVALAIFSWDRIEPREGEFTFDWLDMVIDKLGAAGIAVDLASATATAPIWLYDKHPEVLPVDRYGHIVNAGSRQSWQPTSPVFKEYALRLCRAMAERYANNSYVTAWHMGNEYGWNNRYDYSDNALHAFRSWCKDKYGTIEQLNDAWGTAFWSQHVNSFEEVLLPRHMGGDAMVNPAQQLDYERFGNDMLLDFYKAERDAIEKICPGKPFTTNFMVSTDQCAMDYAKWANEVDFVSNDHYFHEGESHLDELACSDALMDSLALGKPWYVMEHSTSAVQWKPLNMRKRHGELVRDALAHVAMGADAINFFQWRQSSSGAEAFHSAMVPHAGEDSKVFRGVCELGAVLEALSDAGLQGTELEHADTAILFSAESEWATRCQTLPSMKLSHWHDVRDWYRGLLDVGRRADVVPLAYDWSQYKIIILPTVLALPDVDTRRIADFAQTGGTVIIGYATGLVDERFHVGLGGYPGAGNGLLRQMLGIRSEEFNVLGSEAEDEPAGITLSNGMTTRLWQNDVTSTAPDTQIITTYQGPAAADWELDGTPAITTHSYGAGKAIYIGCDLDRQDIAHLVGLLSDALPLPSDQTAADSSQTCDARILHTVRRSTDGAVRFDCYLNRSKQPVEITGIHGEPVVAYRCESVAKGTYAIMRNGVLIMRSER
ncbi:beta-galactosidase [Bifidobacterium scaligerum]|uniref:Beta-galactosidase n=1 Tax=Bifidobacterium scaligerum TaxID=2052656 RepID=A0A2M9HRR8_9BIFI|nr:beta-galactosidase [Bifidobacterium scaligerum]PJM79515.1 beta-galactosidase [Bifidobacterium scaligerum]